MCDQYSISKILTVTEVYHKQSHLENEQKINNDTNEIDKIFEDDIIPEVEENSSNENSSIASSDEESKISSEWNIIEVFFSTSSLFWAYI